jgi:quercetin dioxygenase-like cupin family protein
MRTSRSLQGVLGCALAVTITLAMTAPTLAQDSAARKEIKRVELSGAPGMEVVSSISELKPGDTLDRHFHHGIEAGIVLDGGMIQLPGGEPMPMPTGAPIMNLRDIVHGGFKVVGDKTIRLFTVHIVDKGKPLYDAPR